jgi:hypothetical protein
MAGSLLTVAVCMILFTRSGLLGGIAIFLVAALWIYTAFRARALTVGDEDELNAWVRRQAKEDPRPSEPQDERIRLGIEEWERAQELLREREHPLWGAPPAPSKDATDGDGPSAPAAENLGVPRGV